MKAIIVAGGKGERLRPITNKIPKPMIKVGSKSILEREIDLLKKYNIKDLIITLCYLPEMITSYFEDGSKFGVNITYTYEDPLMPLGTAGAISPAKVFVDSTFIVTYADILRELNINAMIKHHQEKKSFATINIYQHRGSNYKSKIEFNKEKILTKFTELPSSKILKKGFVWSNGSFYIFEPEIFKYIPNSTPSDFSKDIFPQIISLGKKILVYPSNKYFIDIGTPEKLKEARLKYSEKH